MNAFESNATTKTRLHNQMYVRECCGYIHTIRYLTQTSIKSTRVRSKLELASKVNSEVLTSETLFFFGMIVVVHVHLHVTNWVHTCIDKKRGKKVKPNL